MRLKSFHVRNFRRLNDVHVDLDLSTTIFVGTNNSGKTSATQVFKLFLDTKERLCIHDFSAYCWAIFDEIGAAEATNKNKPLPFIELDLWFTVESDDLPRVMPLLPSLDWKDAPVGVRMVYAPKDQVTLLSKFREAKSNAASASEPASEGTEGFHPWPEKLTDYLNKKLKDEYKVYYYVLDHSQFDENLQPKQGYIPQQLEESAEGGRKIVDSLIKVDFLFAQRHQSDSSSKGRSEDLSSRLSRFYDRNLKKFDQDFSAVKALAQSELQLNRHLETVFAPTLDKLNRLGYPGFANPHLVIKSAFDPESVLTKNASVHYALRDPERPNGGSNGDEHGTSGECRNESSLPVAAQQYLTLPDKYNGLGFKNLIYMVIEILDFYSRWCDQEESRAPVHLVFIEEPEAHLHVQLQQVFISKINEIIPDDGPLYRTQLVVTTHSPHIIYESSFTPIRYFQRASLLESGHYSKVLNLSKFQENEKQTIDFLRQYMKLTHCDLFFADAAVLVEGNVERLLLPLMIEKVAPQLKSSYLSILELGGAFAHLFKNLIEFLGITTLVITDLDSVFPPDAKSASASTATKTESVEDLDDEESESISRKACPVHTENAVTSNQTLIQWIPGLLKIADLLDATSDKKLMEYKGSPGRVRVAYQTKQSVAWKKEETQLAGRTFEEMFALENLVWCQEDEQKPLKLRVGGRKAAETMTLEQVAQKIFEKVSGDSFGKTDFALALMMASPSNWKVPQYISEGLLWLRDQLIPAQLEPVADEVDMTTETLREAALGTSIAPSNPLAGSQSAEAAKL
jgi:predicted ATP-dependent endonuclease of OLD family